MASVVAVAARVWHRWRWVRRIAAIGWLGFVFAIILFDLTTSPAAADNCSVYTDCFGQSEAASEAALGLTFLAALSLTIDFIPIVGDVKGVVELFTGKDLITGEELAPWERSLGLIGLVPGGDLFRLGKLGAKGAGIGGSAARGADNLAGLGRGADEFATAGRTSDADPFGLTSPSQKPSFATTKPPDPPSSKPPTPHKAPDEAIPTRKPDPEPATGGSGRGDGKKPNDPNTGGGGRGDDGGNHGRDGQPNETPDGQPPRLTDRQVNILESEYNIDPTRIEGSLDDDFIGTIEEAAGTPLGNSQGTGARGELEAIRDAQADGKTVELLARGDSKTPDFRFNGEPTELKSREQPFTLGKNSHKQLFQEEFKDAGEQILEFGERGAVELRIRGEAEATFDLEKANAGIKGGFKSDRVRNVDRVTVYNQRGEVLTEWTRSTTNTWENTR